jgi:hypothetical protein
MRLVVEKITENPVTLMRRAGYTFQRQEGGEMSFIRPLARAGYPRFHVYTKVKGRDLFLNFHLDQKKETYGEGTRHHGEYENTGPVKEEVERLLAFFGSAGRIV